MQCLEVSCAVRRFFKSLGFKGLRGNADSEMCVRVGLVRTDRTEWLMDVTGCDSANTITVC